MAYSTQRAVSDGTMTYLDLSINYQSRNDIKVFFDDLPAPDGSWAWVGTTDKRINFTDTIANGVEVLVQRTTRIDRIINRFVNGAKFNNNTMDMNFEQVLFLTQEAVEGSALSDIFNDVDFHGYKIKNLGTAVDDNDAVSLGQIRADSTTAVGAAANAKVSETNAKTSETNAAASAAAAAGSATASATSAAASATSATASQTSRLASETARDAAIQARDDAQAAAAPATELIAQVDANTANIVSIVANTTKRAGAEHLTGSYGAVPQWEFHAGVFKAKDTTAMSVYVRVTSGQVFSVTNDPTLAGPAANGRDQAAAFVNGLNTSFYAIWGSGKPVATISSAVPAYDLTGPALPTGYTHYMYISLLRKAAGGYPAFNQAGNRITFVAAQTLFGSSTSTPTAVVPNAYIPATSREVRTLFGNLSTTVQTGASGGSCTTNVSASNSYASGQCVLNVQSTNLYLAVSSYFEVPGNTTLYAWRYVTGSPSASYGDGVVMGYTIYNGSD